MSIKERRPWGQRIKAFFGFGKSDSNLANQELVQENKNWDTTPNKNLMKVALEDAKEKGRIEAEENVEAKGPKYSPYGENSQEVVEFLDQDFMELGSIDAKNSYGDPMYKENLKEIHRLNFIQILSKQLKEINRALHEYHSDLQRNNKIASLSSANLSDAERKVMTDPAIKNMYSVSMLEHFKLNVADEIKDVDNNKSTLLSPCLAKYEVGYQNGMRLYAIKTNFDTQHLKSKS